MGRCQVLKELVGEQRQDGRPRLGRARAGGARCVPGGGRACTAHGADGGCWGGGRDRRPPALAELALQGGQRAASEAAGDGAQSAASAGRKAEAA